MARKRTVREGRGLIRQRDAIERHAEAMLATNADFPNGMGNAESYGNIMRRIYYPLQKKAGIVGKEGNPKYGFHALRHPCASPMIEQG